MFFKFSSKILTTVWYLIAFDFLSFDLTSTSLWSESHDTEEMIFKKKKKKKKKKKFSY